MFSKIIASFALLSLALLSATVNADEENPCTYGPPTAIYCDANEGLKESKVVQTYRGNTKLVFKVSCRGEGVAYGCFGLDWDYEELVGFTINGNDYQPVCESYLAINEAADKYEVTCRGDGFRVDTMLRIKNDD